jgi:hypothetical protein
MNNDGSTSAIRSRTVGQWVAFWACLFGAIVLSLLAIGYTVGMTEHGITKSSWRDGMMLSVALILTLGLSTATYRLGCKLFARDVHIPTRERRSRNILIMCFVFGIATGIALGAGGALNHHDSHFPLLSDDPISPTIAAGLVLAFVLVLPILGWQWHKTVDEHEREAYQVGAVAAAYMFLIGAPVWWLLWRGGIVPEPNGVILYFAFNFTLLIVWLWKKYR